MRRGRAGLFRCHEIRELLKFNLCFIPRHANLDVQQELARRPSRDDSYRGLLLLQQTTGIIGINYLINSVLKLSELQDFEGRTDICHFCVRLSPLIPGRVASPGGD